MNAFESSTPSCLFHMQKNRNAVMIAVQKGRLDCLKEMQNTVSPDVLSQAYRQQSKVWKTCLIVLYISHVHCTCTCIFTYIHVYSTGHSYFTCTIFLEINAVVFIFSAPILVQHLFGSGVYYFGGQPYFSTS